VFNTVRLAPSIRGLSRLGREELSLHVYDANYLSRKYVKDWKLPIANRFFLDGIERDTAASCSGSPHLL